MKSSARTPRAGVKDRALLVVAVTAAVAGVVMAGIAVLGSDRELEATLEAPPASLATPPETVPPLIPASGPPQSTIATPVPSSPAPPGTTAVPSPLAAQLGPRGSATIEPPAQRVLPASITIDAIDLWAPVRPVGLEDDGEMEIPDETEVGWYELGAAPGEEGATVLAAHVTWNDTVGPFYRLGDLEPGAEVRVRGSDGSTRIYAIVERTMYRKDELPDWRIFRRTGPESLVLITCGGSFNPSIRRYRDNIVVYAVPVDSIPGG